MTATGGGSAAGIGAGIALPQTSCGEITINGGEITAIGLKAGIGKFPSGTGGTMIISRTPEILKAGPDQNNAKDVDLNIYQTDYSDYPYAYLKFGTADYTVQHKLQKAVLSGEYILKDTETMTGYVGDDTQAEAKVYPGYQALAFQQQKITSDPPAVVEIRYDLIYSTLTFSANGHGTAPGPIYAVPGTKISAPQDPAEEGYAFGGWYTEAECINSFAFRTMPAEDRMLYAKWSPVYKIIKGAHQTILKNETSAVFASDAPFDKFVRVEVDGKKVSSGYYTAASGSTVITFNKKYISALTEGTHTLRIVSTDGSASTGFTVMALPKTGDNTNPALLTMLLLASVGTILLISARAGRKKDR